MSEVKAMAATGAMAKHPRYHAFEKNIRFVDIAYSLAGCFHVDNDRRTNPDGSLRHPDGYVAKCPWSLSSDLRVDFELAATAKGDTILVVTAMELLKKPGGKHDPLP